MQPSFIAERQVALHVSTFEVISSFKQFNLFSIWHIINCNFYFVKNTSLYIFQNYIKEVLKHPMLSLSLPVRSFLDPKNYSLLIGGKILLEFSIPIDEFI